MKIIKKRSLSSVLCAAVISVGLVSMSNAALVSTLGGLAVYDTDLDISWLADVNFSVTSGFDADGGLLSFDDAHALVARINVGGVTGWRLPIADPTCGTNAICTNSELGHLFHTELGGAAGFSLLSSGHPAHALFANVSSGGYWTGTEFAPNPSLAWFYLIPIGLQAGNLKDFKFNVLAVHSGDVGASAVPEPVTIALIGMGLVSLLGFGRRQHRR